MAVIIGSARISEHGTIDGSAGDQKQKTIPDYSGEVSLEPFYVDASGWVVLRPSSALIAAEIAARMLAACNNSNIGYSQYSRNDVINAGTGSTKKINADCSSLVRECVKEAAGIDPGNFTTSTEVKALTATGLFDDPFQYNMGNALYPGDILVTGKLPYGCKGHTAIVVAGAIRHNRNIITAKYAVRRSGSSLFLPAVTDLSDYAGIENKAISGIRIIVSAGTIAYRLHKIGGYWTRYYFDGEDCTIDGTADAAEVYYYTPEDIAVENGYQYAKYRVSPIGSADYYDWQIDDEVHPDIGMDGYAGAFGVEFDKFQLEITGVDNI